MKRHFPGLHQDIGTPEVPEGWLLVRVKRASYINRRTKSFYQLRFQIIEPGAYALQEFNARLYCTTKALWKLLWFLQAFHYDDELLNRDEIDDQRLVGLCGIIKVSHAKVQGRLIVNLEAFESDGRWPEIPVGLVEVS
jgi:hypothetical protein